MNSNNYQKHWSNIDVFDFTPGHLAYWQEE
jgi:hypothetical protein